ncbi:MAG: tyrosine-type recombinase/integrase [Deltaproteobacteria bacterium]|nr:tyrosine-type recombinase/integrase [Deltaproteobacteria bacterium]
MEALNLGDFLLIYQRFATTENKSPRTIETVTDAVRKFDAFLGGISDITTIKPEDLRCYIEHLQSQQRWQDHPLIRQDHGSLSPHSIACYIRSIRSFWSWLKREDFIPENPFEKVKPPKTPRKIVPTFSIDQLNHLLSSIPRTDFRGHRDYAIAAMLFGTGLRISELLELKVSDINFENGQVKVNGKGSRERWVYMSPKVYKVLLKYKLQWRKQAAASDYLFTDGQGNQLNRSYIEHRFHHYGIKAAITGVRCSPHTLRHSFAVNYLRNGGDVFTLQRILGHSTLEMTRHYAELADSDVERQQKAFSPAEKLSL